MRLDIQQALMNFANSDRFGSAIGLRQQGCALRIRLQNIVQQNLRAAGRLLRHHAHAGSAGVAYTAAVAGYVAQDQI